ncbi:sigma-70 family RNA polymerase sigma factor [Actinoalloteichus hymeniacidonis]|uniref:RNA polymerase sigma factor, sigma-70 family n=1 Tax=Actinoalloteichus hymeniacidonis TaxID=340345 RepID=A0AAC9HPU3_9PSEU|nr:sigma-70 family RNA polymerase sigma factor [Actinoalloteichus hymeniacidonis]AOS63144.1 RNA polymerase sigma factor, sigma-70 family [Actinoalloteichus hymeniacidonis]MBB5908820.1 RNA polymerase sigma-70 factor (ECF subfamily) [Actinoalloteichus hymeniacidonis]
MNERDKAARRFEEHRSHLRAVAYRIVGSHTEAEDAVQETWLRYDRSDTGAVDNLRGWLTRVVARVCLDMLRSRRARRDRPTPWPEPESDYSRTGNEPDPDAIDPEHEAVLSDSVGRALLVMMETLSPAERIALVLHDSFAVPFAEIAPLLDRSPGAAKKLAVRARQKIRDTETRQSDLYRHRRIVDAFLAAVRSGDLDRLLTILHCDVVRRVDGDLAEQAPIEVRGARNVVEEARLFAGRARYARLVLIDGAPGAVVTDRGRPTLALTFVIKEERIIEFEVITRSARLRRMRFAPGLSVRERAAALRPHP